MKLKDEGIITQVCDCLGKNQFPSEELLKQFSITVINMNAERQRMREKYAANAEVYRKRTKVWKKDNQEKVKAYQKEYCKSEKYKLYLKERRRKKKEEKQKI